MSNFYETFIWYLALGLGGVLLWILLPRLPRARALYRATIGAGYKALENWGGRYVFWMVMDDERKRLMMQYYLSNISLSVLVAFAMYWFVNVPFIQQAEKSAFDFTLRYAADKELPTGRALPFLFLDIDAATFDDWSRDYPWGRPFHTPREPLSRLIEAVAKAKPHLIIVDVQIGQAGDAGSAEMKRVLERLDAAENGPPIVIAKSIREAPDGRIVREPGYLDELVEKSRRIAWGSPLYEIDADSVVRRWRLWETECNDPSRPKHVPSLQLVSAAILAHGTGGRDKLMSALSHVPIACADAPTAPPAQQAVFDLSANGAAAVRISLTPTERERTIVYAFDYLDPRKSSSASGPLSFLTSTVEPQNVPLLGDRSGKTVPQLLSMSARRFLQAAGNENVSALAAGRIAVIGTAEPAFFDVYKTPLGDMPGAVIVANSLQSIWAFGDISTAKWLSLGGKALLILVVAWFMALFAVGPSKKFDGLGSTRARMLGTAAASTLVVFVGVLISAHLIKKGVWLDFGSIVASIAVKDMIGNIKTVVGADKKKLGEEDAKPTSKT